MTNDSPTPSLLTRIEKALEAAKHNDSFINVASQLRNSAIDACLELVRQEFAKPPTDEEVERVAIHLQGRFSHRAADYAWEDESETSKIAWREDARAAIKAYRGK